MDVSAKQFLFVFVCGYPVFWLQSFDHARRMRVYRARDLNAPFEQAKDEPPSFFAVSAVFWALCVAMLATSSEGCSIYSNDLLAVDTLFAALAVAACGKCLFGSNAENHKRVAITRAGTLARPFAWRVLDVVTAYPSTALTAFANKLWFVIFGALIWCLQRVGVDISYSGQVIPTYVFLPCTFLFFGRLAAIHVHRDIVPYQALIGIPHRKPWTGATRGGILLWCVTSFFMTYFVLESVLKACGAVPDKVPAIGPLLLGLLSIPILTSGAGIVGAGLVALLSARQD